MYRLEIAPAARRRLRRIPADVARRLLEKLEALCNDPLAPNNNVAKLTDRAGFRLRIGDWRATYDLDHATRIVLVREIELRGDAYR